MLLDLVKTNEMNQLSMCIQNGVRYLDTTIPTSSLERVITKATIQTQKSIAVSSVDIQQM